LRIRTGLCILALLLLGLLRAYHPTVAERRLKLLQLRRGHDCVVGVGAEEALDNSADFFDQKNTKAVKKFCRSIITASKHCSSDDSFKIDGCEVQWLLI
jgi:hypothetical protein